MAWDVFHVVAHPGLVNVPGSGVSSHLCLHHPCGVGVVCRRRRGHRSTQVVVVAAIEVEQSAGAPNVPDRAH